MVILLKLIIPPRFTGHAPSLGKSSRLLPGAPASRLAEGGADREGSKKVYKNKSESSCAPRKLQPFGLCRFSWRSRLQRTPWQPPKDSDTSAPCGRPCWAASPRSRAPRTEQACKEGATEFSRRCTWCLFAVSAVLREGVPLINRMALALVRLAGQAGAGACMLFAIGGDQLLRKLMPLRGRLATTPATPARLIRAAAAPRGAACTLADGDAVLGASILPRRGPTGR